MPSCMASKVNEMNFVYVTGLKSFTLRALHLQLVPSINLSKSTWDISGNSWLSQTAMDWNSKSLPCFEDRESLEEFLEETVYLVCLKLSVETLSSLISLSTSHSGRHPYSLHHAYFYPNALQFLFVIPQKLSYSAVLTTCSISASLISIRWHFHNLASISAWCAALLGWSERHNMFSVCSYYWQEVYCYGTFVLKLLLKCESSDKVFLFQKVELRGVY